MDSLLTDEAMAKLAEVCGARRTLGHKYETWTIFEYHIFAESKDGGETYQLTLAGERMVMEKLGIEMHQDDEESDNWRGYKRRRYGGTEYPYKPTYSEAVHAAVVASIT